MPKLVLVSFNNVEREAVFKLHAGGAEDGTKGARRPALFADDFAQVARGDVETKDSGTSVLVHVHLNGIGFVDKGSSDLEHQGPHVGHGALLRL